ncbi:MAG: asparaginase [Candidatus Heimdallarchaeaceae archaeon]
MLSKERRGTEKVGILITHGTDTMAWTFHYLQYTLKNLPCNIVLTGSQIPLEWLFGSSDSPRNLESAIRALTQVRGPNIFMTFNQGKHLFFDSIRKVHMTDEYAFEGDLAFEFLLDTMKKRDDTFVELKPRKLDKVIFISTGGTIESERSSDGYLKPMETPNVVKAYLSKFEGIFFTDLIPRQIRETKDSSNMTPDDWSEVADIIVSELNDLGFKTTVDKRFNHKVGVIYVNPFTTKEQYLELFAPYDGIIIAGYGSGNINILETSMYSMLEAVKEGLKQGKVFVLASQVDRGVEEPIYEVAWKPVELGVLPSGNFGVAKSQVKLAYLLGHMEDIERVAKEHGLDPMYLLKLAFLTGIEFQSLRMKLAVEELIQAEIIPEEVFFNTDFTTALQKIVMVLKFKGKRHIRIQSESDLKDFLNMLETINLRQVAAIIKPDTIVGYNKWGESVNSGKNIVHIIDKAFEWGTVTFDFGALNYDNVINLIKQHTGKSVAEFFNGFKIIFIEGGTYSVYDNSSFRANFTKEQFIDLIKSLTLQNVYPRTPVISICLGHQGVFETLRVALIDLFNNKDLLREELKEISTKASEELYDILKSLEEEGETIEIIDKQGNPRASGIKHEKFAVSPNELTEVAIKRLYPYKIDPSIPKKYSQISSKIADLGSGIIEDIVSVDDLDVSMLHGDEVNELAIHYFNFALNKIFEFRIKYSDTIKKAPTVEKMLNSLPLGIEITCSTVNTDMQTETVTEVASTVIYYYDANTNSIQRDFTFQFHPELMQDLRTLEDSEDINLDISNDGIKIFISSIYSSYCKQKLFLKP